MVSRGATLTLGLWGAATLACLASDVGAAAPVAPPTSAATAKSGPFEAQLRRAGARLAATRGRPEAVAPLSVVAGLMEDVPPRMIEELLRPLATDPASDPLVAAQAALVLARLEDHRGDSAGAAARRDALGLFRHYWVVGPFGDGRSSFTQPFPPELESGVPDPSKRYPGKAREVAWRKGDGAVRAGALLLDGLLRPDTQAVAYVLAFVRSDSARPAAVRLGSPGPIKVWLNGAPVFSRDAVRAPAMDQDAAAVQLARGWNRLLIKTVVTDGPWRIYARVTDPRGRPLPVVNEAAPPAGQAPVVVGRPARGTGSPPAVATLEAALRARARAAGGGAAGSTAWLDLARYLAWAGPTDRQAREDLAAAEESLRRRPSAEALAVLADIAREDDERRLALERLLALGERDGDPGVDTRAARALAMSRLGEIARAANRDAVAMDHWREALRLDPSCWPAAAALASEELEAGLPRRAVDRLAGLPGVLQVPRLMRLLVRVLEAVDRRPEADALLEEIDGMRQLDGELAHQLAGRARTRGDATRAIAYLRRAAGLRPDLPSLTTELARAMEGAGDQPGALAVLTELDARLPDEPGAQAQLGKLLHRMGKRDEALVHLRGALALKPQDPELRRYTERVASAPDNLGRDLETPGEDLARRYASDAKELLAPVRKESPARAAESPDPAVVLLDRRVVRVHHNGLSETFAQRVVQIETDRGAEDNKQFYVRYTPGLEEVEIRQARIFRRGPGGAVQILQAGERDDQDLSEPWYGLYYDNRAEVVQFEGLRAGDVLEVQYVVADVAGQNMMADYFGDLQFIAEVIPKRRWEYVLIGPTSRTFHFNTPRVAGLTTSTTDEGGDRIRRFAARDVAKIAAEPAMPGYAEVGPYLHLSTYANWGEVGVWYWRLVAEQLAGDELLRKTAREAAPPRFGDEQKVRAIHDLVVSGTRYVGLEFGIHGFKPYKVTQVLSRRFGDCKDKAALMVALLREVGVEAEMVLLRTRAGGRIDTTPASLAVFDHAIVYVPKLDIYLDGTAEFAGKVELPSQDQGVMGLRVSARGATLVETPILPSRDNRAARAWNVEVSATGAARITEKLVISGQAAPEWREHYQTPGERLDRYAKVWSGRYPGANLISVDMTGVAERNQPVTVQAVASVPRLGQVLGEGVFDLPVTVREADFSRTYARLSERKYDLLIAYPWQHEEELVYRLPAGARVQRLPAAHVADSPFGHFRLEVKVEAGNVVRVSSSLDVTRHRVAPAEYARFRQFLGEIDAALSDRIVVERILVDKGSP